MVTEEQREWMYVKYSPDNIAREDLQKRRLYVCPLNNQPEASGNDIDPLDPSIIETVDAALNAGEAELYDLGHVYAYLDPYFNYQPLTLAALRYDSELGLHIDPKRYEATHPDY